MKNLTGNTYEIKEALKSKFKARWNALEKKWSVEDEVYEAAQAFVNNSEKEEEAERNQERADRRAEVAKIERARDAAKLKFEALEVIGHVKTTIKLLDSNRADYRVYVEIDGEDVDALHCLTVEKSQTSRRVFEHKITLNIYKDTDLIVEFKKNGKIVKQVWNSEDLED